MSVSVTHRRGAIIVRARTVADDDCLSQVVAVLADLDDVESPVVLELTDVAMVPTARIRTFLQHLMEVRNRSASRISVVVERPTGRRLLRAISAPDALPILPSIGAALESERP